MAQSGFHCSLAWPPVTGVSKRSPVSGRARRSCRRRRRAPRSAPASRCRFPDGSAGTANRSAGRSSRRRRQHDGHHRVVALQHPSAAPRRSGPTGSTRSPTGTRSRSRSASRKARSRALLCAPKLSCVAERVGHLRQRLAEMRGAACSLFGTLSGTLRRPSMSSEKAISRVGIRVAGEHPEGVAHHAGAGDLAEGADMRQAGGTVAGLEQRLATCRCASAARRACAPPRKARLWRSGRARQGRGRDQGAVS